ncbi:MAG: GtrA family protein, partial [Clostridia bacterium]|nr:GtrA family protein [Clostridia bacterium]
LFSISAGVIQIGSFALLFDVLQIRFEWLCYFISVVLSVVWNFTFNRKFTFKSKSNVPKALILALLFYVPFLPLTTLLEHYLTNTLMWNAYIATAINMILNFVLEFLWQRFFVFGKSIDQTENKE